MRLYTTLMMTAMVAAPMVATAAPSDMAQTYVSLAKPATGAKVGAVVRAGVMPGLAVLPAEVECCVATTEIRLGDFFVSPIFGKPGTGGAEEEGAAPAMPMAAGNSPFADPDFAQGVTSYAMGVGRGMSNALNTLIPILQYLDSKPKSEQMVEDWANEAAADYSDAIRAEKLTLSRAAALEALKKLPNTHLSPVYGVVTMNHDGGSAMLPDALKTVIEQSKGNGAEPVKENGWQGWKYKFTDMLGEVDATEAVGKEALEILKERSIYHIFKIDGNALVMCICESPSDCKIVDSADASVLGSDKMAFYDPALSHKLVCAAYVHPGLLNAVSKGTNESVTLMSAFVGNIFRAIARENEEKSLTFGSAARGVDTVAAYLKSLSYEKFAKPFTLGLWQVSSGAYHARLSMDACGASYAEGELKLSKVAASSKTIYYSESTPYTPAAGPSFVDVIAPALNIYSGYDTSLAESEGQGEKFAARGNSIATAMRSLGKSLGNTPAFVVFDVKGTPAATYFNTVTNVKSLASSANMLGSSIGILAGGDRNMLRQYYKVKKGKSSTVVNFTLPAELGGMKPSSLYAGNKLAVGTSAALNQLIMKNAVGKRKFAGTVYTMRPASLAGLMALAGAADPSGGMVTGMAGAVLGGLGDIHAVDTITEGVRNIHILVKRPKGTPAPAPIARPMPGGAPAPAATADDEEEEDEEEEEEEDEEEEEEE